MKAYVIKNKEGKYYQDDIRKFGELYLATFYKEEHFAIKDAVYLSSNFEWQKNYKVVEVTISEGDLEQEIEELKTRISELQDKDWYEKCISQLEEQNDKLIKERDALQSKVSNEEINSTGIIPKPKFNIGSTVIAKTINCKVVIEDRYYDSNLNKWLYQFHAPSSVMEDDYYSTYSEDHLEEIREEHNDQ